MFQGPQAKDHGLLRSTRATTGCRGQRAVKGGLGGAGSWTLLCGVRLCSKFGARAGRASRRGVTLSSLPFEGLCLVCGC